MRSTGGKIGFFAVAFGLGLLCSKICPDNLLISILTVTLIVIGLSCLKR